MVVVRICLAVGTQRVANRRRSGGRRQRRRQQRSWSAEHCPDMSLNEEWIDRPLLMLRSNDVAADDAGHFSTKCRTELESGTNV